MKQLNRVCQVKDKTFNPRPLPARLHTAVCFCFLERGRSPKAVSASQSGKVCPLWDVWQGVVAIGV